ncbi:MarR family winged helix-turn-helix transcriptional regulator [Paenibacillus sp. J22TS3]|uniref:MarR family winged helix-turn-helix transcriptional regulator n=1 Tax=Paenibacillus sp. J22TS3 TaxID=2807192 RepID=UPI001B284F4C|nr:MarR family transcriptional regulator [Paenibacillus sp. J22TS3]GIP24475.1 transcriptional regulator [Paenibacillus sp. J22TS3]
MNSPLDESVGFHMGVTYRKLSQLLQHRLRDYHITPEQWSVLYRIWEKEGQIQKEIGERSGKDKPTTTRILAALEEKGFIRRESGEKDRRSYSIFITDEGKRVIEQTEPIEHQLHSDVTEGLSEEEKASLLRLLRRLTSNADELMKREKKE